MQSLVPRSPTLPRSRQPWSRIKTLPIVFGILGLTLAACSIIPAATPALAQEKVMARTLTVTGRGTESIQATLAEVRLGVEVQGKTAEEVQREVARRSSAVVELLRSRNVDKLQTTGINLNPTYNYDGGRQTLTGYSASNIVSFRIASDRAGTLLDEAVKAGATRIDGISFTATDEAIAAAREVALREATQEAQQQAGTVLTSLQLAPKEIVSIQINNASPPPPMPVPYALESAKVAAQDRTPIIGGEQQVEAFVTLQIRY